MYFNYYVFYKADEKMKDSELHFIKLSPDLVPSQFPPAYNSHLLTSFPDY
jgi:hypothetical protein